MRSGRRSGEAKQAFMIPRFRRAHRLPRSPSKAHRGAETSAVRHVDGALVGGQRRFVTEVEINDLVVLP